MFVYKYKYTNTDNFFTDFIGLINETGQWNMVFNSGYEVVFNSKGENGDDDIWISFQDYGRGRCVHYATVFVPPTSISYGETILPANFIGHWETYSLFSNLPGTYKFTHFDVRTSFTPSNIINVFSTYGCNITGCKVGDDVLTITFTRPMTITRIQLDTPVNGNYSLYADVYITEDGSNWYKVGEYNSSSFTNNICSITINKTIKGIKFVATQVGTSGGFIKNLQLYVQTFTKPSSNLRRFFLISSENGDTDFSFDKFPSDVLYSILTNADLLIHLSLDRNIIAIASGVIGPNNRYYSLNMIGRLTDIPYNKKYNVILSDFYNLRADDDRTDKNGYFDFLDELTGLTGTSIITTLSLSNIELVQPYLVRSMNAVIPHVGCYYSSIFTNIYYNTVIDTNNEKYLVLYCPIKEHRYPNSYYYDRHLWNMMTLLRIR